MGFPVSDQVNFMLPLLGLKAVLGSAMVTDTAAAQDDDDGPHQPEPPEFIVVAAALSLSTAVSRVTDVALIVGAHTGFLILSKPPKERHPAGASSSNASNKGLSKVKVFKVLE